MIICNECGAQLKEAAKFCTNCGTKVDPLTVEKVESQEAGEVSAVENPNIVSASVEKSEAVTSSPSAIENYLFDYWDFLKESLITPSAIFTSSKGTWINGLISVVLLSIAITMNIHVGYIAYTESFFSILLVNGIVQAIIVGVFFVINRFVLGGNDDYPDALGKYGGLINTQIILFLLIRLLGIGSSFSGFLVLIILLNTVNIFNTYVLKSQTNKKGKLDNYYQFIVSYIALAVLIFLIMRLFAGTLL